MDGGDCPTLHCIGVDPLESCVEFWAQVYTEEGEQDGKALEGKT